MGMVRDWRRQTVRATGVSLIAPIALLVAALAVSAGGGLGGLGSLTQLASGPSLPATDIAAVARDRSIDRADVVALRLSESGTPMARPPAGGDPALTADSGPSPAPDTPDRRDLALAAQVPPGAQGPIGPPPGPQSGAASPPLGPAASPPPPDPPALPAPPAPPPAPYNPVTDLIDNTRDFGESLPGPLGDTTGDLLDRLLGPRP